MCVLFEWGPPTTPHISVGSVLNGGSTETRSKEVARERAVDGSCARARATIELGAVPVPGVKARNRTYHAGSLNDKCTKPGVKYGAGGLTGMPHRRLLAPAM